MYIEEEEDDGVTYSDDSVQILGTKDTFAKKEAEDNKDMENEEEDEYAWYTSLASYILTKFYTYRDARRDSGIEEMMLRSHRAYNRQYDPEDLALMPPEGSRIFMPLTTTKCRAACSWIRDVLQQVNEKIWTLETTPIPDLPKEIIAQIEQAFTRELEEGVTELDQANVAPENAAPQSTPNGVNVMQSAAEKLRKLKGLKRDIEDAVYDQIKEEANYQLQKIERVIEDQLIEGDWEKAFADFIQDFTVFPAAIMKGPVISKENKVVYINGVPTVASKFVYKNKRVSPYDMYPSPSATGVNDGDMIEHIRFSRGEVYSLKDTPHYKSHYVDKILESGKPGYFWLDPGLEEDKANLEKRGDSTDANEDIYHGLHFHGSVPVHLLLEWGMEEDELQDSSDPFKEIEVEAILINGEVVKCIKNEDPLGRRPYYKACWQDIPGSFWGLSLPYIMRDIQRMCNATARALADNLGLSSGPMMEVYIDRLADSGALEAIHPRQIWQMKSDPTGGGGRSINFFDVPSHAQELLYVYDSFEQKADDATGIPRYAYGNEKTAGAATTASGLAMLLESVSKGVKDAIRNIDLGLIVPRIQYQFYWNMLVNKDLKYTGDINVVSHASKTLVLKAAQAARRQEFLQITANPKDQEIMGYAGRADILRILAKDLGLPHNLIPSKFEMQKLEKELREREAKMAEAQAQKESVGLQATKYQTDGQKEMHMSSMALRERELAIREQESVRKAQLKIQELQASTDIAMQKQQSALAMSAYKEEEQNRRTNKQLAVDIQRSVMASRDRDNYAARRY